MRNTIGEPNRRNNEKESKQKFEKIDNEKENIHDGSLKNKLDENGYASEFSTYSSYRKRRAP